MSDESPHAQSRRLWQFSIRALLLVTLVIFTFLAGRGSLQPELDRAREEANRARAQAEQARRERLEIEYQRTFDPTWDVEKGMQIDALEHDKRFPNILSL